MRSSLQDSEGFLEEMNGCGREREGRVNREEDQRDL